MAHVYILTITNRADFGRTVEREAYATRAEAEAAGPERVEYHGDFKADELDDFAWSVESIYFHDETSKACERLIREFTA